MDDVVDLDPNGATAILPELHHVISSLHTSQGVGANYTSPILSVKPKHNPASHRPISRNDSAPIIETALPPDPDE
jgi:hypothetical protein